MLTKHFESPRDLRKDLDQKLKKCKLLMQGREAPCRERITPEATNANYQRFTDSARVKK